LLKRLDFLKLRRFLATDWLLRSGTRLTGSHTTAELTLADLAILPGQLQGASEVVAVADGALR
jgi:hypothetical protein